MPNYPSSYVDEDLDSPDIDLRALILAEAPICRRNLRAILLVRLSIIGIAILPLPVFVGFTASLLPLTVYIIYASLEFGHFLATVSEMRRHLWIVESNSYTKSGDA